MQAKYEGTGCKGPDKHKWPAGAEVFYDKETKAICIDSACFTKLKEAAKSGASPGGNGKALAVPVRTNEKKLQDAVEQLEKLWTIAHNKAVTIYHPEYTMEKASEYKPNDTADQKDIRILAQCLFKGLSMGWASA